MSVKKKCKLINDETLPTSTSTCDPIDWTLCALCQESSNSTLQCPALSKRLDKGAGYETLAKNLRQFVELGSNPIPVNISRLDEGDGIEKTLAKHEAKWHPSCRLKCSSSRLARVVPNVPDTSIKKDGPYTRKQSSHQDHLPVHDLCFLCNKMGTKHDPLHEAMTSKLTDRVNKCALKLQDKDLIAKLSAGDLVAQEAKYHSGCLVKLYNASSRKIEEEHTQVPDGLAHGIALVEVIRYLEDTYSANSAVIPVFKLKNILQLYTERLTELGVEVSGRVNSTRLKERLLAHVDGLHAYKQGRDILLSFNEDIGPTLKDACLDDCDDEAICLGKAAEIIRRHILEKHTNFNGTFDKQCQEESVPNSLVAFLNMVMDDKSRKKQQGTSRQATLSIAQLIQYNSCTRRRQTSKNTYHKRDRETPLAIYLGLMIHGHTRKRELVDKMFQLGLAISYDRILEISTEMAISASLQYGIDGVVCPLILRKNLFTTAAVDNIDHNLSSTTAHNSFHGTGISLFQNRVIESDGTEREKLTMQPTSCKKQIPPLPESYTNFTAVTLKKKDPVVPFTSHPLKCDPQIVKDAIESEANWLKSTRRLINQPTQSTAEPISWSAFHANTLDDQKEFDVTISSLLPLFPDDSKSVAMIRHSMDIIRSAVEFLNPGQVPVITLDQPLFAIAKLIQWNWPDEYGEDKLVVILGGLHTEMDLLKALGKFLDGSGWTNAITEAKIATSGTADSFITASHVTRTRHAHQVTASALSILIHKAYDAYKCDVREPITFDDWCKKQSEASPQFHYWCIVMKLEILILIYVRSLRESNFKLYVAALEALAPWCFSLDQTNYARWLPVHIRDMITLHDRLPEVAKEFDEGKFVVHKTNRAFSALPIDHAHEQNNAVVKGEGGAIGLLQNPRGLLRWMVAGPELARVVHDFEVFAVEGNTCKADLKHHEHTLSTQVSFAQEVKNLVQVIDDMGNPFTDNSGDLLVLDSRDIADQEVADTVHTIENLGDQLYQTYVTERLLERKTSVTETIKRNNLSLFSRPSAKGSSKVTQVALLKSDCELFSRLYIACQTRDGDLDNFFKHENHAYPPALSQLGKIRIGKKADLLECLENLCSTRGEAPVADVIILDGAAIVNMLKPVGAKTFQEYATLVFLPYVRKQLSKVSRVDIIWDMYRTGSLKSTARQKRGKGIRRRVAAGNTIPGQWQEFLRIDSNKTELFDFLAHQVEENILTDKEVYTTCGENVLCTRKNQDVSAMEPCTHEEADTRIFVHLTDAVNRGHDRIIVRTVDTDVVVLAVSRSVCFPNIEVWVAFGVGKQLRFIPAHDIAIALGVEKARGLPFFHSFTGCDTVSSFGGKGKKTCFDVWKVFNEVTPIFTALTESPSTFNEEHMSVLESFVVRMYDRSSTETSVDATRKQIFTSKGRSIDNIPPTSAALFQHTKRATYQGGHIWGQSHICCPDVPSPDSWGWKKGATQEWEPLWTLLPEAAISCSELLRCGCVKGCRSRCKCVKANLKCTALCHCMGDCEHNDSN